MDREVRRDAIRLHAAQRGAGNW
jgi:Arm DNA-binding domain